MSPLPTAACHVRCSAGSERLVDRPGLQFDLDPARLALVEGLVGLDRRGHRLARVRMVAGSTAPVRTSSTSRGILGMRRQAGGLLLAFRDGRILRRRTMVRMHGIDADGIDGAEQRPQAPAWQFLLRALQSIPARRHRPPRAGEALRRRDCELATSATSAQRNGLGMSIAKSHLTSSSWRTLPRRHPS